VKGGLKDRACFIHESSGLMPVELIWKKFLFIIVYQGKKKEFCALPTNRPETARYLAKKFKRFSRDAV